MHPAKWQKWIVGGIIILALAITFRLNETSGTLLTGSLDSFPTWKFIRLSGLLAYLLLCLGISLGIVYSLPVWTAKQKIGIYKFHSIATISGTFCGIMHAMFLLIDSYIPFSWIQLLVPFTAPKKPVIYGLGTITMYGLLLIIFTTDIRGKLSGKVWTAIHMCAYPIYVIALAHGMLGGTDAKNPWIFMTYVATFVVILSLMVIQAALMTRSRNKTVVRK